MYKSSMHHVNFAFLLRVKNGIYQYASLTRVSRDIKIKWRVGVIEKKIEDLQRRDVPCAFVYATYWIGGIYVWGDKRITGQIKSSASKFLETLKDTFEEDTKVLKEQVLSAIAISQENCLNLINGKTICSMLVGLGKDSKFPGKTTHQHGCH